MYPSSRERRCRWLASGPAALRRSSFSNGLVEIRTAPHRYYHGWQRTLGQNPRIAAYQRPRARRTSRSRMRGRLRRTENRISNALRLLGRELATSEKRGLRPDAVTGKISERENARVDREKCSSPGNRAADGFAEELPGPTAQNNRANLDYQRPHP